MAELIPYDEPEGSSLTLADFWRLLGSRKKTVLFLYVLIVGLAAAYAFTAPPMYRAEVMMTSATPPDSSSKLGALASQLGGLASMVGGFDSGSDLQVNLAVLESRDFTIAFIERYQLMPILFANEWDAKTNTFAPLSSTGKPPTLLDAYNKMKMKVRKIEYDDLTGIETLAISWKDPQLTAQWANDMISMFNEYLRERSIQEAKKNIGYLEQQVRKTSVGDMRDVLFRLIEQQTQSIMLAETREQYAFRVLDKAMVPEVKESPKPLLIILVAVFIASLLSFSYLLLLPRPTRLQQEAR